MKHKKMMKEIRKEEDQSWLRFFGICILFFTIIFVIQHLFL